MELNMNALASFQYTTPCRYWWKKPRRSKGASLICLTYYFWQAGVSGVGGVIIWLGIKMSFQLWSSKWEAALVHLPVRFPSSLPTYQPVMRGQNELHKFWISFRDLFQKMVYTGQMRKNILWNKCNSHLLFYIVKTPKGGIFLWNIYFWWI